MLPFSYRLPTPQVSDVLRRGKRVHAPALTILYSRRDAVNRQINKVTNLQNNNMTKQQYDTAASRFAFVAGVKVSKKAVERNRVKRLFRESVQHLLPSLAPEFDVVIVAKKELVGKAQGEVEEIVTAALKAAALM